MNKREGGLVPGAEMNPSQWWEDKTREGGGEIDRLRFMRQQPVRLKE